MNDPRTLDPTQPSSTGDLTRRSFIRGTGAAAAATAVPAWLSASAHAAPTTSVLRLGLVGCGGRGRGAVANAIEAAERLGIKAACVAVCDYFETKAQEAGNEHGVPQETRFHGPASYHQLMQTDVDLVILATPPVFRPVHLAAAVEAGKHVFMEKPVAVDPPGCRQVMSLGDLAATKGLKIVAGTQRRHHVGFQKHAQAIREGKIGTLTGGQVYWCMGELWYKTREPGESDADYLIRNWVSFTEMSGDHIVEQNVHLMDVANWFVGRPPVSAVGVGSRQRRVTGNQYDNFSIDFDYGKGCAIQCVCRQINGCWNKVDTSFIGTEGRVWDSRRMMRYDKAKIELADLAGGEDAYVQEHIALQSAIVNSTEINEARQVAESNLAAVMGRIAAYSGQQVRWDDVMNDPSSPWYSLALSPSPADFESGSVVAPQEGQPAVPGA